MKLHPTNEDAETDPAQFNQLCFKCKSGEACNEVCAGGQCVGDQPHWSNPWTDVVYVPIEELAECAMGLGLSCTDVDGSSFIMTKEKMLEHWKGAGEKLDAYILPQPSGWHDIGIRYGAEGSQYLSPMGDKDKVAALLKKYQR